MPVGADRPTRGPYAKSSRRRVEIVDAAIEVFASHGYHGGSLREISRELGMSLTAVTHHFPSKSELLEAVLERADSEGDDFVGTDGVVPWVLRLVARNLGRPELLRVLAIVSAEASAPDHPAHAWFVDRYDKVRERTRGLIERDQALGRIDPGRDPGFLADATVALWDGLQLQWLIDPRVDMQTRMRQGLRALIPEVSATGSPGPGSE